MLYYLDSSGSRSKITWAGHIKNLLFSCNLHEFWDAQIIPDVKAFIKLFVTRFKERLYLDWFGEISTLDKLDSYRSYKTDLQQEHYLFVINITSHRIALSRFRCSSHCLKIETDRKNEIDRNERLCDLCDLGVVENEYHFLLVCPFFKTLRNTYIPQFYTSSPSHEKFISLMKSHSKDTLQRLAAYLFHALKLRFEIYRSFE